jgi:hypothetical protein
MKGALVFLGVFAIFVAVTLGYPSLPFGSQIYYAIGGVNINYPILGIPITTLVPAVFNGVIYGFVVWLIYSIASGAIGRGKKTQAQTIQQNVTVKVEDKEKDLPRQRGETVQTKIASRQVTSISQGLQSAPDRFWVERHTNMKFQDFGPSKGRKPGGFLTEALGIQAKEVISLVGAGGKTTLMFRLAQELFLNGKNVVTTTTTKILEPTSGETNFLFIDPDGRKIKDFVQKYLNQYHHITVAKERLGSGKLGFVL